ncbi:transcriptional regulator [Cypionkella aquatica]|uniref:Transcriptional regulator n=1 Tax=Cypionkella aquatica TaxID=1756042 RepID=A0AA37TV35_9RHOB|nr:LysR family transcriptional regulator [Cypionkella aquatica]GLS86198.1 transcriptional regulator [Cypionkella aquatica]
MAGIPMEMHQIKYFLAVTRTLNFTRAADQCNVTQPSLTRAIQKLEDEFGGFLFNRERALTHLTELGRMVLPHLEQTYEAAEAATSLASSIGRAEVTPLVIGVADGLHLPMLDEILAALSHSLPALTLDLRNGSAAHLLDLALKGNTDLLITALPDQPHDRLETWPLFTQPYGVAIRADHRHARAPAISIAELAAEPWIDSEDAGTALLRNAAASLGLAPLFRHRAACRNQILRLVALGLGHAIVPLGTTAPGIKTLAIKDHPLHQNVVMAAVSGRRRGRAADAFLRAARACNWQSDQPCPETTQSETALPDQLRLVRPYSALSTAAGAAR